MEQLAVKEIVSTFPTENLGYFSYCSWHFILAKLLWCYRGGCRLGSFLVLLFLAAVRGAGLSVHEGLLA